jgi:hypothetical protein
MRKVWRYRTERKRPADGGPFPLHERETCFSRPLQGLHLRDDGAAAAIDR